MTPALLLHALHHLALPTPWRGADEPARSAALRLGEAIGRAARPHLACGDVDDYLIAATLNASQTSDPAAGRGAFREAVAAAAGREPSGQLNAYECVGWAPALRYVAAKARQTGAPRRVLLQIADADLHGLRTAWDTQTYGRARFGITSLVIDVAPGAEVEVGSAPVARSMMAFAATLRRWAQRAPQAVLALPFFPEPARSALQRAIPGLPALPDHHDAHGHCFGSDPWIAIALDRRRDAAPSCHVAGSLALSGYHGVAAITLARDARCSVEVPA